MVDGTVKLGYNFQSAFCWLIYLSRSLEGWQQLHTKYEAYTAKHQFNIICCEWSWIPYIEILMLFQGWDIADLVCWQRRKTTQIKPGFKDYSWTAHSKFVLPYNSWGNRFNCQRMLVLTSIHLCFINYKASFKMYNFFTSKDSHLLLPLARSKNF